VPQLITVVPRFFDISLPFGLAPNLPIDLSTCKAVVPFVVVVDDEAPPR
jgi:hypothetical protein